MGLAEIRPQDKGNSCLGVKRFFFCKRELGEGTENYEFSLTGWRSWGCCWPEWKMLKDCDEELWSFKAGVKLKHLFWFYYPKFMKFYHFI